VAIRTLRRRAGRQREHAQYWTVTAANGVRIIANEGAIAPRIATALDLAPDEREGEP
jgi:hypothetical protein